MQLGYTMLCEQTAPDAGFTHVALVQIGSERQHEFFDFAEAELLPALRGQ